MSTAKSEPLAAGISNELASRIISDRIAAGACLRQDQIAEEFGASHVPVRAAFRLLEAPGLVENVPRRGASRSFQFGRSPRSRRDACGA